MPPEPLVRPVQRYEQLAEACKLVELAGRVGLLEDGVANRTRQLVEDRGTGQKPRSLSRERSQHLVAEVLRHEVIVAGEAAERAAHVVLIAKRQGRQIQPRGPSFGLPR